MPRLFKKFFVIIWLTLAASVAVIILIVHLLQTQPFAAKLERQKREIVLNLTENILVGEGEAVARRFARTSEETVPLGLVISRVAESGACTRANTAETRDVPKDGVCYRISVSPQTSFSGRLAPFMLWFAILISSTISAAALARYLIRPVVHLRDGLSALAHGRFDVRIGDKMAGRKDEVTALAHDFDSTAARLEELQAVQQQLFHDVSHELRSPLSRLQAVVGVLRQSPAKLDAMLDRMDREVERLDMLVGEVLTLARLTIRSSLPLKTQTLDVIELLNEILGDAAFEAQAREVSITACVDGVFLAAVEGELVYRALENIIRNAVKYTAEHSQISVQCETEGALLRVCVTDQGPGVGRDELERIFQPFSRGTNAMPRGGYGLGLAIARQAVERHGGRVYASLPPDGGLAVTLELPRQPLTFAPVDTAA
ncbi:HAMP domain-containing sensor histidine kinase [Brucella sp. IR073]|uniref:HAMP domain-containing sensor histidine kinase n=1 Tax=unclassified Brucella TaxID=2632610 RepID=UPI003B986FD1